MSGAEWSQGGSASQPSACPRATGRTLTRLTPVTVYPTNLTLLRPHYPIPLPLYPTIPAFHGNSVEKKKSQRTDQQVGKP
jgi:hypothetical protein